MAVLPHRRILKGFPAALALIAIAGSAVAQSGIGNPPPAEKLGDFSAYELKDLAIPELRDGAAKLAAKKLDEHLHELITPVLEKWRAAAAPGDARTLVIQPVLVEIYYVGGKARFWGGAFGGNSTATVRLEIKDAASGATIATPEFYQRANGVGAAWSFGATDKDMLRRVARLAAEYLDKNHDAAVGGMSGRE